MTHASQKWLRHAVIAATACATLAVQARASTWFVIVSGIGGEPDYEQRFTSAADELDRIFKAEGPAVHATTLTGAGCATSSRRLHRYRT